MPKNYTFIHDSIFSLYCPHQWLQGYTAPMLLWLQLHAHDGPLLVVGQAVHATRVRAHLVRLLEAVRADGAQVAVPAARVRVVLMDLQELARLQPLRAHVALHPQLYCTGCWGNAVFSSYSKGQAREGDWW